MNIKLNYTDAQSERLNKGVNERLQYKWTRAGKTTVFIVDAFLN